MNGALDRLVKEQELDMLRIVRQHRIQALESARNEIRQVANVQRWAAEGLAEAVEVVGVLIGAENVAWGEREAALVAALEGK